MARSLPLAILMFAALAPLAAQEEGPFLSAGLGVLLPGKQTIQETGQPDQKLEVYKGGPVVDLAAHWREGKWLEPRLRASGFYLAKGSALLSSGTEVGAETYGATLVYEGQLHLWQPDRPGPYLTFGAGAVYYHYTMRGFLNTDERIKGSDAGATFTLGCGFQLGDGWELEARYDGHFTANEVTVVPILLMKVDPNPTGVVLLVRKRL